MKPRKLKCHSCGFKWKQLRVDGPWTRCPECGEKTTTLTTIVEKNDTVDVIEKMRFEDTP